MKYKYFDRNESSEIPEIPKEVAVCPICEAHLVIEDIDEWEAVTGRVTENGFTITCVTQPDLDDDDYEDWFRGHYAMPYVYWLSVEMKVYRWFDGHYRLALPDISEDDRVAIELGCPCGGIPIKLFRYHFCSSGCYINWRK